MTPAAAVLALVATLVLLAGVWSWLVAAARAAISWRLVTGTVAAWFTSFLQSLGVPPRLPLVAWNTRRPVPWTGIDLLIMIGLYLLGSAVAVQVAAYHIDESYLQIGPFRAELTHEEVLIAFSTFASLAMLGIGLPLISVRTSATPRDFGWSVHDIGKDLKIGVIAFVMLAPPVYAIQGLLVSFWQESKHPLVEMFKEQPNASFFGILFVSAAIVAPLFEEVLFRVLLQGFLEKVLALPAGIIRPAVGTEQSTAGIAEGESGHDVMPTSPADINPYSSPAAMNPGNAEAEPAEGPEPCLKPSWAPIFVSSAIFAVLHYSHGPDWIPLFFLALGLGYLYQRTHRLVPGLIVHSLLNTISMWGLWVTVNQGPKP